MKLNWFERHQLQMIGVGLALLIAAAIAFAQGTEADPMTYHYQLAGVEDHWTLCLADAGQSASFEWAFGFDYGFGGVPPGVVGPPVVLEPAAMGRDTFRRYQSNCFEVSAVVPERFQGIFTTIADGPLTGSAHDPVTGWSVQLVRVE